MSSSASRKPSPPVAPVTPEHEPARGGSGIGRPVGLIAGGLGIAGIAVGSVFGLMTRSAINRQRRVPPGSCTPPGNEQALGDHELAVK